MFQYFELLYLYLFVCLGPLSPDLINLLRYFL